METLTDQAVVAEITLRYQALSSLVPLRVIHNQQDYENAVSALNRLLDAGAANNEHPLADLVNALGNLIGDYEDRQYPTEQVTPVENDPFFNGSASSISIRATRDRWAKRGLGGVEWEAGAERASDQRAVYSFQYSGSSIFIAPGVR